MSATSQVINLDDVELEQNGPIGDQGSFEARLQPGRPGHWCANAWQPAGGGGAWQARLAVSPASRQ